MAAQYHLQRGLPKDLFSADSVAAPVTSTEVGVIAKTGDADGGERVRWQTRYSVAPASCSIVLQGSLNPNAAVPVWFDLDTTTNVNGETREVVANIRGLRINKAAQTGVGALTATVLT